MSRVELIETREQASAGQTDTFDRIVASRGMMLRPFAVLLHAPEVADAVADLGAVLRYRGSLSDRMRELVICVTAHENQCGFEWDAHSKLALEAGVAEETMRAIAEAAAVMDPADAPLVVLTRELCRDGSIAGETFERVRAHLGDTAMVELIALIGYYTLLAMVMNACEAC